MIRALVLPRETRLSAQTRLALRALPWEPPPAARPAPAPDGWGLASYDAIPDLVIAEYADPIAFAKLLDDLVLMRRALPAHLTILVGETADELTHHLLAPAPIRATVIGPGALADALQVLPVAPRASSKRAPALRWRIRTPPHFVLRHWDAVRLLAAFDTATTITQAAGWSAMARSTAFAILASTAEQLHLPRRWRHPREWRDTLLAALSYPDPVQRERSPVAFL